MKTNWSVKSASDSCFILVTETHEALWLPGHQRLPSQDTGQYWLVSRWWCGVGVFQITIYTGRLTWWQSRPCGPLGLYHGRMTKIGLPSLDKNLCFYDENLCSNDKNDLFPWRKYLHLNEENYWEDKQFNYLNKHFFLDTIYIPSTPPYLIA